MTQIAEAMDLLRPPEPSGSGWCNVSVMVPYGPGAQEYHVRNTDLARIVPLGELKPAGRAFKWAIVKPRESRGVPCTEQLPVDDDTEMREVPRCLYITAGTYYNPGDAWTEYSHVKGTETKKINLTKPAPGISAFRRSVTQKQAYERERLEASYTAHHLGDAMCTVLAQCLARLQQSGDINTVWAALYKNTNWLASLEVAATAVDNLPLAATARRMMAALPPPAPPLAPALRPTPTPEAKPVSTPTPPKRKGKGKSRADSPSLVRR